MPTAKNAACNADVPEFKDKAYLEPIYFLKFDSNISTIFGYLYCILLLYNNLIQNCFLYTLEAISMRFFIFNYFITSII